MNSNAFSAILEDPETMKKITALAGEFAGSAPSSASPASSPAKNPAPSETADPAAELMQRAVPLLSSIVKSGQSLADSDRIRLLTALKPFVSPSTAAQFDRAIRLLSVAHMTRTAAVQVLAPNSPAKEV
jgi:hypothetical protein